MFELGYMLFARSSIFMISVMIMSNALGLCMVYFIVFSETMGSIFDDLLHLDPDHWLERKQTWILALGVALLPVILMRELQELHIVSVALFCALLTFVTLVIGQSFLYGTETFSSGGEASTFANRSVPSDNIDIFKIIKCCCVLSVAFAFSQNLFPIYSSLTVKTNPNMAKCVSVSVSLTALIYSALAVAAVFLFGE